MNVTVLMASGDEDTWGEVEDVVEDRGSLVVLYEIAEGVDPSAVKTLEVREEDELGVRVRHLQVAAQYAPGMWIKVEFE